MVRRIDLASHKSLEQVRAVLESLGADGSEPLLPERQEQYGHIQRSLVRFRYRTLRRAERGWCWSICGGRRGCRDRR